MRTERVGGGEKGGVGRQGRRGRGRGRKTGEEEKREG